MSQNNIIAKINHLPENTWQRQYAEASLAANQQPIVMTDIPDQWFTRFAQNQRRTVIFNGRVALPLEEFLYVAINTMPIIGREFAQVGWERVAAVA